MRRFLTIDQSLSSSGFTLWDEGDDLPIMGTWAAGCTISTRAHAFVTLHREIGKLHKEKPITFMAYEQPIKTPSDKVEKLIGLYGLAAHIESIALVRDIWCERIDARSWRRTFLGPEKDRKGVGTKALKKMALDRCRLFEADPQNDDEGDSFGMMDHLLHTKGIQPPWRLNHPFLPILAVDHAAA